MAFLRVENSCATFLKNQNPVICISSNKYSNSNAIYLRTQFGKQTRENVRKNSHEHQLYCVEFALIEPRLIYGRK
jgi:hypothetical protein